MANLTMDLTGTHKNYAISNRVFSIFKTDQFVDFGIAVFKESIKVYLLSGGLNTELELDKDYIIPEHAISSCDNDTSSAKLMDSKFDKKLVSGIQFIRGVESGTSYVVSISYQQLYPNQLRTAYYHNTPLTVTPDLVLDMINRIEQLTVLSNKVTDVSSLTSNDSLFLEVDASKTNDHNYIQDEEHILDVPNKRFIIHPKGGSFYYDSVKLFHPSTGEKLVLGKDYFIVGMDEARTKASSHTSPVYKFILVVLPISDTVLVTYHAFGGDPTLDNYREILMNMNNVIQYLNEARNVTEDTLGHTEIMTSVFERLDDMEDRMRRLERTPSYGDITFGKSILMKLLSQTTGLHWYTIASLYKVTGTERAYTADTFMFRLQSELSHFQFTAAVSVDLLNTTGDKFNVNILSNNYPRGFIPFKDYSNVDSIIRPQLRMVWAEGDQVSGALLQLGFDLKGMLTETICIEDMSGHESAWKMVEEIATSTLPSDDLIKLPNSSTWSSVLPECKQECMMIPFTDGQLIWAGAIEMNRPINGWQSKEFTGDSLLLDNVTNIRKLNKLRLNIEEEGGLQFPIDIPFSGGLDHAKGHATFTHQNQPAYINAEMYRIDGKIKLRINYDVTAGIESNKLILRDMVIY